MGQFFIVLADPGRREFARGLFRRGLRVASSLPSREPSEVLEAGAALVASFRRLNGSGTPVVSDPDSGRWLIAAGTWFHAQGFGSGSEARLLQRFRDVGPDRLAGELEGFFVVAAGDRSGRDVTLITDINGSCHAFSRTWEGVTALAGSSLLLAALGDATLEPVACQEFLASGAIYEDRTLFEEVRRLDPVTCFRFRDGALLAKRRYWTLAGLPPDSVDGEAAVEELTAAMVGAARRIHAVHPRVVCDLTGGYDSRIAVAAFLAAGVPLAVTVAGPETSPDVVISKRLARAVGLPHRYLDPGPVESFAQIERALELTDGELDIAEYARIEEVQRTLSASFDVSVNGYAGEHGRGYGWEILVPHTGKREPLDSAHVAIRRFGNDAFASSLLPPDKRVDLAAHFRDMIERTNAGNTDLPNTSQYDFSMMMTRAARWQGRFASATNRIWPCLSFFLMRSVQDVMLKAHTRARRRSLLMRRVLVRLHPELARYPLADGHPPAPMTWSNAHRYLPLVAAYGGKAWGRLGRALGIAKPPPVDPRAADRRLLLWRDPDVRTLLESEPLRCVEALDATAVRSFLRDSTREDFSKDLHWERLLTIECALRRLEELRGLGEAAPERASAAEGIPPRATQSPSRRDSP
jgi:hypothetical protein